ncbi:MAG: hypothetical protein EZS28_045474 [Streblomastix strix]|uniref:Uncharacterized protein n=1 Tax=Streblomastix strix TaxID=222440 RepID=A0A5J4TMF4_9EUKA|nr:MAG: hypothetical protein EZS28_045474 [Streblomastix strix]
MYTPRRPQSSNRQHHSSPQLTHTINSTSTSRLINKTSEISPSKESITIQSPHLEQQKEIKADAFRIAPQMNENGYAQRQSKQYLVIQQQQRRSVGSQGNRKSNDDLSKQVLLDQFESISSTTTAGYVKPQKKH